MQVFRSMEQTATDRISASIRAELARRRITGRQLAQAVGWSTSATARRLNGHQPLTVDDLDVIAAYLKIPAASLIGERAA